MAEDRGEWRGIYTVLQDTPEFIDLPPEAQLVWFHLKLRLGPAGINSVPAVEAVLGEVSGYHRDTIEMAFSALIEGGWLVRQRNVLWLRNALKYEPSRNLDNGNHVKSIANHIAGLPKLKIVNDFAEYYGLEEPFDSPTDEGMVSEGYRDTIEIPSPITEDGRRKTEDGNGEVSGANAPSVDRGSDSEVGPERWMHDVWHEVLGIDGHSIKLNDNRKQKYRAMYEEQLSDAPDPETAWRAVLWAVTRSDHHMSDRAYQMPESLLRNESRRETWVQKTIDALRNGGTRADRKAQKRRDEVLEYLNRKVGP